MPWLVAAGMALVAVAALVSSRSTPPEPAGQPLRRFTIQTPLETALPQGEGTIIAISPDGETLVYSAQGEGGRRLYRRSFSEFEAEPIRGTEGAVMPFFSPDGAWVAFEDTGHTEIRKVPLSGGEPFRVCRSCDFGSWADDGSILFEAAGSLYRVAESGGEPELLADPIPERGIASLGRVNPLPGGAAVLFDINTFVSGGIGFLSLETREPVIITDYGSDPFYSPTGHILFGRERSLMAVPFDLERLAVTGPATAVLPGVRVENGGAVQAALSRSGALAYVAASDEVGTQLVWVQRGSGDIEEVLEEGRFFRAPRISPDGQKIALQVNAQGRSGVWIREGGTLRPLTEEGGASNPIWTPDGRSVTLARRSGGAWAIQSLPADGSGPADTIVEADVPVVPEAWSLDGNQLLYREVSATFDLFVADVREPGSKRPFVASEFAEHSANLSPSGRWVAYVSDQTGVPEIYVRPFPEPGRERRVSRGGGFAPVWGPSDSELVFRAPGNIFLVASLRLDHPEVVEQVEHLFDGGAFWAQPDQRDYDMHVGTGRLLMLHQKGSEATSSSVRVVEGWFSELERLAPPGK